MYFTKLLPWYKTLLNVNWILLFMLGYFGLKWYINSTKFTNIIKEKEKKVQNKRGGGSCSLEQNPTTLSLVSPTLSVLQPPQILTPATSRERERASSGNGDNWRRRRWRRQGGWCKSRTPNPETLTPWSLTQCLSCASERERGRQAAVAAASGDWPNWWVAPPTWLNRTQQMTTIEKETERRSIVRQQQQEGQDRKRVKTGSTQSNP